VSADLVFPIYCHNDIQHLEKEFSGKGLQIFFLRAQGIIIIIIIIAIIIIIIIIIIMTVQIYQ
jgi:hypothetical protein